MLPSDERLLIEPAVIQLANVVKSFLALPTYLGSATKSNQLVYDTMQLIQSHVFEHGTPGAAHLRLPAEQWCRIFILLPQRDRFAVSRVSRNWRSVTIGTHALWTDIDYRSASQKIKCTCRSCTEDMRRALCRGCGQWVLREIDNLGEVRTALARSGTMPLRVYITLVGQATSSDIAGLLRSITDRITYLHIAADIWLEATDLLAGFDWLEQRSIAFENLRHLIIVTTAEQAAEEEDELPIRLFDPSAAQLPALLHLELQGLYQLYHAVNLRSLQHVRLPIHNIEDFGFGLELCTNVRYLHYEIVGANIGAVNPQLRAIIQNRIIQLALDVLVVSELHESIASAILDVAHIVELADLTLAFTRRSVLDIAALDIISDIGFCQSVSWNRPGERGDLLELIAVGPTGMTRKIMWYQQGENLEPGDQLWEKFPSFGALDCLEIDQITWEQLHHAMPDTPELRTLSLVLFGENELSSLLSGVIERIIRAPRLERLRLQFETNDPSDDGRREFAQYAIRALDKFPTHTTFRKLQYLEISGLDLISNVQSLNRLAERVLPA